MKQKIIIGLSVTLLLLTIYMIARDLFKSRSSLTQVACCGEDYTELKQIDTALIGYIKIRTIETGTKGLTGITVGKNGDIYSCGNKVVEVFDSSGKRTRTIAIDTAASCLAIDDRDLYIGMGPKVACYDISGEKKTSWEAYNTGGFVTSVAINSPYVYIADAVNKRILKCSEHGRLEKVIGKKDSITGSPGFIIPSMYFDIAFGAFNDLWAVNPGRLQIENYTPSGIMQFAWGEASYDNGGFTGCCNPAHMALLPDGSFVTYEKGLDKIKVFNPTGEFLCMVAGAGSFRGNADFQLGNNNLVKDIATGIDGRIYVLDAYNNIVVFKKKN
jgi:hypothetical protein